MSDFDLKDNTKAWRAVRFLLFCVLIGVVAGVSSVLPGIDELKTALKQSALYLSLACLAMIAAQMLLVYVGGFGTHLTGGWKPQLLGLVSFFWAITTANMIARLLLTLIPIESSNDGVMVLFYLIYFTAGCLILAPFQYIAFRAYRKRKGLPYWPNLPKE